MPSETGFRRHLLSLPSIRQTYPTYSCFESSFPRRRESRSVGAETYRIKRLLQSRVPDSHFRGNDGIRFP
ncbi:hypothetical protein EEF61_08835, partial [Neisseria gonorrhoeae]